MQETLRQTLIEMEALMANASVGILFTKQRRITRYNRRFAEMFGFRGDEGLGMAGRILYPSDEAYERLGTLASPLLSAGRSFQAELEMRRQDDTTFWAQLIGYVIDREDTRQGTIWIIEDRTDHRRNEQALQQARAELEERVRARTADLARTNRTLRMISQCNQELVVARAESQLLEAICRIIVDMGGYPFAWVGLAGEPPERKVNPAAFASSEGWNLDGVLRNVSWADGPLGGAPTGTAIRAGSVVIARDMLTNPLYEPWRDTFRAHGISSTISLPLENGEGAFGALTIYAKEPEAFLAEEAALLQEMADDLAYGISALRVAEGARVRDRAIESSIDGIMISDACLPHKPIVYVNPAFERITGYARDEVVGRNGRFLVGEEREQIGLNEIRAALREGRPAQTVLRCFRKDGSLFWNDLSLAPVRDEGGRVTHVVSILNDVTDRVRYEEDLERRANYDSLTGLPNRNLLADRLEQAIAHAQRYDQSVAVVFFDLDHFKVVNDTLGHRAGDDVVKQVAQRLSGCVREADTVARVSGDEFVLVFWSAAEEEVAATMQRIQEAMGAPFEADGRELYLTCSMGASFFPKDGRQGQALLRNSDAAMYRAKEDGRDTFRFYRPEMSSSLTERLSRTTSLRRALERRELVVHYQPQVDLASGAVVGAEALVRWQREGGDILPPHEFIPLAEETGLIGPIGEWVLEAACEQNAAWQREGLPRITVAVNLSARQFDRGRLCPLVQEKLALARLEAGSLELELTEGMLMHDVPNTIATMQELSALGVHLSLDDFGTGYSSLSYLKRFPIEALKIDQSFVRDLSDNPDDAAIVVAVIAMAHSLGLRVVAEGVETRDQLAFLRRNGCDLMQGFYFAKPLPAAAFAGLLRTGQGIFQGRSGKMEVSETRG